MVLLPNFHITVLLKGRNAKLPYNQSHTSKQCYAVRPEGTCVITMNQVVGMVMKTPSGVGDNPLRGPANVRSLQH